MSEKSAEVPMNDQLPSGLVSVQQTRRFSFGSDLLLQEEHVDRSEWPERMSKRPIQEEGLETLLLLNLDTLWPGYSFRLGNKTLNDWDGADIEAEDSARCWHLFEVKYGADADNVVDQALAYALSVLGRTSVEWFADEADEDRELFLGARIAGFWANRRADKAARDATLAPRERYARLIEDIVAGANNDRLSTGSIRKHAALGSNRLAADPPAMRSRDRPHHVEFRVIVPDVGEVRVDQLLALGRLRFRKVRASIWEAAVNVDRERLRGTLWIREQALAPLDPSTGKVAESSSSSFNIGAVLASMHRHEPALASLAPRWLATRWNRTECRPTRYPSSLDREQLQVDVALWEEKLEISARYEVREHARSAGWQRKSDPVVGALATWIAAVAPPPPDVAVRLRDLVNSPKSWQTAEPTGLTLSANHSASGCSAAVEAYVAGRSLDEISAVAARATRTFLELIAKLAVIP